MASFALTNRLLSFTSPAGANVLLPERLYGSEGISELFCYKLDLLAQTSTSIAPTSIVGKRVCVGISADDSGTQRYINGIVSSFEMMNVDEEFACYRATIVPSLWMLTLNKNTRVFQNKTVVDVIQAVLSPYSISPSVQTSNTYAQLEYCTQYRETDFDFISRLMEQHGIFYYFAHSTDNHTLTLQDTSSKLSDCPIQNTFKFRPEPGKTEGFYDFVVNELSSRSTLVTGKHTAWDYSFVRYQAVPGTAMNTAGPLGTNSNEAYDYAQATGYVKKEASDTNLKSMEDFFTTVRRDSSDAETLVVEGSSNAICMQSGYTFSLTEHKQAALNTKYVLVHVEHSVQQLPSYRTKNSGTPQPFENRFRAIPSSIVYRPPITTVKPVVHGMHTGLVVVSSGEESHMDKYGRVNVQFWWDRLRQSDTPDNTWLRVAQSWAGKGWGTYFWPRIDDEVLIGFMEGDPDQPIVVGSVYNGTNMPKYDPAGQYTLSGILTRSSKGGGAANANELRFEDLSGKEQIFMNAEKDYTLHVEHDWQTTIGNEQHITLTSNRFDQVGGDSHLLIKGKHLEEIDGDADFNIKGKEIVSVTGDRSHSVSGNIKESVSQTYGMTVGQNLVQQIGQNHSLQAGQNQNVMAGQNCNVTAGQNINLTGGMAVNIMGGSSGVSIVGPGGFISITDAGISIMGTMVMINSGGAPVPADPAVTQSPQSPDSPTAPTAPKFPGDDPNSQAATAQSGQAGTAPSITEGSSSGGGGSSPAAPPPPPPPPATPAAAAAGGAAANAASQAADQAAQGAQQAAQQAQQAANQAQQAAQQADQQAQQALNQAVQQARGAYNQAQQAAAQAQQAANQAVGQAKAAAQQAANQAEQQAQQAAQQAAAAVQAAQQQAQQVQQQAQAAAAQAQAAAKQAQQQAQAAAAQAQQAANAAKQQGQQAAQQAQQAAQQAEQQAQQAANQAKQAAGQAQQQAQQAAGQVTQAASGAQQQAQQAAQGAQQSAQQAMSGLGGL